MLFRRGAVTIASPGPFDATDASEDFGSDFAVEPVVGAAQLREFTGEADGHMTWSGTLLPSFYGRAGQASGPTEIEMLRAVTGSGVPQPLVRGEKRDLGSWLVERVSTKSASLSAEGVGRVVAYDVQLVRSTTARPTPRSITSTRCRASYRASERSLAWRSGTRTRAEGSSRAPRAVR